MNGSFHLLPYNCLCTSLPFMYATKITPFPQRTSRKHRQHAVFGKKNNHKGPTIPYTPPIRLEEDIEGVLSRSGLCWGLGLHLRSGRVATSWLLLLLLGLEGIATWCCLECILCLHGESPHTTIGGCVWLGGLSGGLRGWLGCEHVGVRGGGISVGRGGGEGGDGGGLAGCHNGGEGGRGKRGRHRSGRGLGQK